MRTIDPYHNVVIDRDITAPTYLVAIVLNDPMNLSTREGVDSGGIWWESSKLQVNSVGIDTATLRIDNHDYAFTAGAMTGAYLRKPVKIYSAYSLPRHMFRPYFEPGYFDVGYFIEVYAATAVLLFDGYITDTPDIGEWLTIEATRSLPKKYPSVIIRKPLANHLPATGMVIEWDGETYRIEA